MDRTRAQSRRTPGQRRFFAPRIVAGSLVMALIGGVLMTSAAAYARTERHAKKAQLPAISADPAPVHGEAPDGTNFNGAFTLEKFQEKHGVMYAVGTLEGSLGTNELSHKVRLPVTGASNEAALTSTGRFGVQEQIPPTPGACDILTLTLGPLDLDLLGLRIALDTVNLLIEAVPGAGNLLGNLLCAVAGLLDPGAGGLGGLLHGVLDAVANLLNQLLGGLSL